MLFSRIRTRFLTRLGAPAEAAERHRIERGLASARVFLAGTALLAIWLDPTEPSRYATLAYVLLISYVVYSVVIWLLLDRFEGLTPSLIWIHGFDVAFPAFFTLFTAGPNSPFFLSSSLSSPRPRCAGASWRRLPPRRRSSC